VEAWFELRAWIRHMLKAKGPHGVHSPYVFHLITKELLPSKNYSDFAPIEALRKKLLRNTERLEIIDFGAGSRRSSSSTRRVCDIVRTASNSPRQAQMLFRWANFCQPSTILELGTNMGLSTAYLGKAVPKARTISLEGAPALVAFARENLKQLSCHHVQVKEGHFRQTLPEVLEDLGQLDFAWIDGHHEQQATLEYVEMMLPYCHERTVLLLDDIHWSKGMNAAWEKLSADTRVTLSLDFFHYGALLFMKGREKEHFRLRG
jgi:predicted O-methyltransferase YrrM